MNYSISSQIVRKPARKKLQVKSDEANITNLARRFTQIKQIGADLKRLRNLYSSHELVHRMSKKRNKNILVPA